MIFLLQDNYNRMLQEQKPKKPIRKKPKPSAMTRPPKRNKKKKKTSPASPTPDTVIKPQPQQLLLHQQQQEQQQQQKQQQKTQQQHQPQIKQPHQQTINHFPSSNFLFNHDTIMNTTDTRHIMSRIPSSIMSNHYLSDNSPIYQFSDDLTNFEQQELFTVCENSSAYESSEDTGVGGLSESELMGASDGIGMLGISSTE